MGIHLNESESRVNQPSIKNRSVRKFSVIKRGEKGKRGTAQRASRNSRAKVPLHFLCNSSIVPGFSICVDVSLGPSTPVIGSCFPRLGISPGLGGGGGGGGGGGADAFTFPIVTDYSSIEN